MPRTFIAVDWGTTNRRVFLIDGGQVTASERDPLGVLAMAGRSYESEVSGLRARFGDWPVIMAGMVGSTIGWREVPYVALPANVDTLAAGLVAVDEKTAIVPGLALRANGRCDVMRGEEVQLLGAVGAGLAPPDSLLCQPGTHCKWALMQRGEVVDFTTAMTGELFSMLRSNSVLSSFIGGSVSSGPAFQAGVARGAEGELATALFGIRAAHVLGELAEADAPSFASGVLIGSDVAPRLASHPGTPVHVLAGAELGSLYRAAIGALGGDALLVDSRAAFVAGVTALQERWT